MTTFIGTIDRKRYDELPGMEGPYLMRSGKVLYYDPEVGQYYDRDTDFYLTYDEYLEHDKQMFNLEGPEWEWCGYTYHYDIHEDEDTRKIWHEIQDSTGNTLPLKYTTEWSPYRWPTEEQFQNSVVEYMLTEYFKKEKYSVGF